MTLVSCKRIQSVEEGKQRCRGTSTSSAYRDLTLASCFCISEDLGASDVQPEPHRTETRGDVILIG